MEFTLFIFFALLLTLSSYIVISSQNPINSVLYLILAFCNASAILIIIEIEFLALLFLIVYVGAIAVLFLFVVIILNLKDSSSSVISKNIINYSPIAILIGITMLFQIFIIVKTEIKSKLNFELTINSYNDWIFSLDSINSIDVLSQVLYSYYFYFFLLAGLVLLIAIIGAISLTSKKELITKEKALKKQLIFQQITRNSESAVFLIKRK